MSILKGKDILHANQFSKKDIDGIIKVASEFEKELKRKKSLPLLKGNILATLFFEPSTRTRFSFETAMQRMELASLSALSGNQRSLVPDGQPVVIEIAVTEIAATDKQPQAGKE